MFLLLIKKDSRILKALAILNDQYLSLSAPPGWGNPSLKQLKGCTVDPEMGEKWFSENQTKKTSKPLLMIFTYTVYDGFWYIACQKISIEGISFEMQESQL